MARPHGWIGPVLALGLLLGGAGEVRAQADPQNFLFNTGQTIQPFFEGWTHTPDGGFAMHFGYLNRNYVEELHVPIGETNRFTSGAEDQGQPTFFYPRVNHRVFSVTVPADFADRDGLPPERERGGGGQGVLPTFAPEDGPTLPINVPQVRPDARKRPTRTRVERVNVTWTQWRGPTGVTLESVGDPEGGVATVTARFEHPGEYLFKVAASDGPETLTEEIAVTVR